MKTYIGVDLGGTNVRAAIVDEEGKIIVQKRAHLMLTKVEK